MATKNHPDARVLLASFLRPQFTVISGAEVALQRAADAQAAGTPNDPAEVVELVHEARVALRRLRSTLRTFAPAFAEPDRTRLLEEAGWYAGSLGGLRDLDVIGARVRAGLARLPESLLVGDPGARLEADLAERRAARLGTVAGVLETERYARLRTLLERWAAEPAWSPGADRTRLLERVTDADRRLDRRVATAAAAVLSDDPDALPLMHAARRAAKRHRYAVELVAPLLGGRADRIVAGRRKLQDRLGELQDSLVTSDYLTDLGRRLGARAGGNVFSFGALAAVELRIQHEAVRRFAKKHR